jgi:hypothetical protein
MKNSLKLINQKVKSKLKNTKFLIESGYRRKRYYISRDNLYAAFKFDVKDNNALKQFYLEKKLVSSFSNDAKEQVASFFNDIYKDSKTRIIQKAEKLCNHEFEIFEKDLKFKEDIDWHYSPDTEKSWPQKYSKLINIWGSSRTGDYKYTWELNRHQYFLALGQAYIITGDEKDM